MKYFLGEGFYGGKTIEIDAERHGALLSASQEISCMRDIEECFSVLARSFIELEKYLFGLSIEHAYYQVLEGQEHDFFDIARREINLKLTSFLGASRMYEEHTHRRLSDLSRLTGREIEAKKDFEAEFDQHLEYRVMYALRNHSFHHRLPLNFMSFGNRNLSSEDHQYSPSRLRITVSPKIITSEFCASDKVRLKTRAEVEALNCKYLDLKFFVRIFVACLYRIHAAVRKLTEPFLEDALSSLKAASDEIQTSKGCAAKFISLSKGEAGDRDDWVGIDYKIKSRVVEIRKFWASFKGASRVYVSSELTQAADTYPTSHSQIWIPK